MRSQLRPAALLVNLGGSHLPPLVLSVSSHFQFCVDAGAASAVGFFSDVSAIGLHDHVAASLHEFMRSVRLGMAGSGESSPAMSQQCMDAFAAGYLGRIQQEMGRPSGGCRGQTPTMTGNRVSVH